MQRYDVALWRWWPSLFPEWCELVEAASPFAAVEAVMRRHGCMTVQHAAAQTQDGLVVYRGFRVRREPGGRVAPRAAVKHPWELEAWGCRACGEQAMPPGLTLDAGG